MATPSYALEFLGGLAESDSAYYDRCSVVCTSVTLVTLANRDVRLEKMTLIRFSVRFYKVNCGFGFSVRFFCLCAV